MTQTPSPEEIRSEISAFPGSADDPSMRPRPIYADALRGALLGLLAGVVYFVLMLPARQNAQRSSCQSNLKQIGLAYKQYITDYDEKYPLFYTDQDGTGRFDSARDQGWVQNIQPYCKNVKLFQCPSEANPANLAGGPQTGYTDYFTNGRLRGMSEAMFTHIASTVLLGDHRSSDASCNVAGTSSLDAYAKVRHRDGANYSFVDGHVKWLKPHALTDAAVSKTNYSFQGK
jgi:prepilin-type processing-associated H-X9-DG protein